MEKLAFSILCLAASLFLPGTASAGGCADDKLFITLMQHGQPPAKVALIVDQAHEAELVQPLSDLIRTGDTPDEIVVMSFEKLPLGVAMGSFKDGCLIEAHGVAKRLLDDVLGNGA